MEKKTKSHPRHILNILNGQVWPKTYKDFPDEKVNLFVRAYQRLSIPEQEEQLRIGFRHRSVKDFYFFTKTILGYKDLDCIHLKLCNFMRGTTEGKRKLILLPRGHLKSTICNFSYAIWRIIQDPNIRILITNATYENAVDFLREIKGHFQKNKLFREMFGAFCPPADKEWGNQSMVVVPNRDKVRKEPTIEVGSANTNLVSKHYDLIICDDLVNQDNVNTKELRDKTSRWFKQMGSLLDSPAADVIVVGTRWHFGDLYSELIKAGDYEQFIKRCYEDGKAIYPKKYNKGRLEQIKKDQGGYIFSCFYLNDPADDESAEFKRSWIKYFTQAPLRLNKFMTIDLAISKKEGADYTVVMVCGVDEGSQIYVLEYTRARLDPSETIDEIFRLYLKHRPRRVGIETVSYQKALIHFLKEEMKKRSVFLPIVELKADADKRRRILRLSPRFSNGMVYITDRMVDLEEELLRFPIAEFDDIIDALAYQVDIMQPPPKVEEAEPMLMRKVANMHTGYMR